MKTIPITLQNSLNKPGKSTCFLVKIVATDGTPYGFASLDSNLQFDDGFHNISYASQQELRPQNIQQEANFETDNTELTGWFTPAIENLVLSGKFDVAEVTIYRVAYLKLSSGAEVIGYGTVGQIDFSSDSDGKRKVEFLGLTQRLQQHIIDLYSLTCRAAFGDDRCGMPFVWEDATVSSVADNPYTNFVLSGVAQADGYFDLGVIKMTSGENNGATMEVESWLANGTVQLSFLLPYPVQPGDTCRIRRDCDKTATTCKAYGNIINMRAEHLTPVEDKAIMVPGAYVKSVGAQ